LARVVQEEGALCVEKSSAVREWGRDGTRGSTITREKLAATVGGGIQALKKEKEARWGNRGFSVNYNDHKINFGSCKGGKGGGGI